MAIKAFKDYTIEDLYRLNFSFLIQSIKDKELEDALVSEEVFIKGQKIALMNIFSMLDAEKIDSSKQTIEPFLQGRRLITDLNSITAIVFGLKNTVPSIQDQIVVDIPDELARTYANALKVPLNKTGYLDKINNCRSIIAGFESEISSFHNSILTKSRQISEQKEYIKEYQILLANEKLKPQITSSLTETLFYLKENNFRVVGMSIPNADYSKVIIYTTRICKTKVEDPDRRGVFHEMPLFLTIRFCLSRNGIEVNNDRGFNRRVFHKLPSVYIHPHIGNSDQGSFCLGNTATLLSNITRNGVYNNVKDFIKIYGDLLDSYNSGSPYHILQECFLNNANLLLYLRSCGEPLSEDNLIASIDLDSNEVRSNVGNVVANVRDNYTSSLCPSLVSDSILEFLEYLRNSIDGEMIRLIENSNIDSSMDDSMTNNYYDGVSNDLCNRDFAIEVLKQYGGIE